MGVFLKNKKALAYYVPLFLIFFPINKKYGLNGFPFEGKLEVVLFIIFLCIPFLIKKSDSISEKHFRLIMFLTIIFCLIQMFSDNDNYNACYKTKFTPTSNFDMNFNIADSCQFSFDKPFDKSITRNDYFLNFNQYPKNNKSIEYTNWNLYFFNQTGFNFYEKSFYGGSNDLDIPIHWILKDDKYSRVTYNEYVEINKKKDVQEYDYGFTNLILPIEPSRSWLSFGVNWSSESYNKFSEQMKISYVGEVTVTVNDDEINLEPSYTKSKSHTLLVPVGADVEFDYFYRFNGLINSTPSVPYASFNLTDLDDNPINIYESKTSRVFELISSFIFLSIILLIFYFIYSKNRILGLNFTIGIIGILFLEFLPNSYADIVEIFVILSVIIFIKIKQEYKLQNFLSSILIISISSVKNLNLNNNVLYSLGGSDPLKYESWSQQIVFLQSLQGGEDIYLYQPGYRYLLSLFHLFFGDSHLSIVIFFRFILVFLLFSVFLKLFEKYNNQVYFLGFNFLLAYILLSTYSSKLNLFSSLSEWPTWILGLMFLNIFFKFEFSSNNLYAMCFLLGACFLIRENQFPGLVYLVILMFFLKEKKQKFFKPISIFGFFLLLPFLHNFIYGGEFVLNQDVFISGYYYLSPRDLLFDFQSVYETFLFQLNFLTANPLNDSVRLLSGKIFPLTVSVIIVQFLFIFAIRLKNVTNLMYFIIPFAFLGPHLFYQVHTYYPRHIIQGYLFMVASTMLINLNNKNSI